MMFKYLWACWIDVVIFAAYLIATIVAMRSGADANCVTLLWMLLVERSRVVFQQAYIVKLESELASTRVAYHVSELDWRRKDKARWKHEAN